jgi:hypothetical protein
MQNHFPFLVAVTITAALVAGCDDRIGDYIAAASISEQGFVRPASMPVDDGRPIQLWGYVDYGNLFGGKGAEMVLGDLWSGEGPSPSTWRFNLKAREDDPAGHSFAVIVPNDEGRDTVLQVFSENARTEKPTRVFLKGTIHTFDAPSNLARQTGLYVELASSRDIFFNP